MDYSSFDGGFFELDFAFRPSILRNSVISSLFLFTIFSGII